MQVSLLTDGFILVSSLWHNRNCVISKPLDAGLWFIVAMASDCRGKDGQQVVLIFSFDAVAQATVPFAARIWNSLPSSELGSQSVISCKNGLNQSFCWGRLDGSVCSPSNKVGPFENGTGKFRWRFSSFVLNLRFLSRIAGLVFFTFAYQFPDLAVFFPPFFFFPLPFSSSLLPFFFPFFLPFFSLLVRCSHFGLTIAEELYSTEFRHDAFCCWHRPRFLAQSPSWLNESSSVATKSALRGFYPLFFFPLFGRRISECSSAGTRNLYRYRSICSCARSASMALYLDRKPDAAFLIRSGRRIPWKIFIWLCVATLFLFYGNYDDPPRHK